MGSCIACAAACSARKEPLSGSSARAHGCGPVITVALGLWLTWDSLRSIHVREVRTALRALDTWWIAAAAIVTAFNVAVMGCYDVIAFRHTRSPAHQRLRTNAQWPVLNAQSDHVWALAIEH